ncbi:hypothetical protein OJAV_G00009940 [Oryzias javanicus]|uniref:Uncharacterized protein n=1 Tax=Oryzias javanicus TaxID=123683 RepID=A0A437DP08_ORYJA|nr:hypothetical protein OJAV_G00009940 [Oryzias javanicus]
MRRQMLPSPLERRGSPPSQIWLNVTRRLGAERFPGGAAEGAGAWRFCLSARDTKPASFFPLSLGFGDSLADHGSIAVLRSPLRDAGCYSNRVGGKREKGASLLSPRLPG